ncbi:MAG: tRNA (guanosine(46)-N7)-methyltransferase TrmB, partial [Lacticaseibacillus paracasei]
KRVTDNVPTEYEEKFSADGGRIYELVAHFKH